MATLVPDDHLVFNRTNQIAHDELKLNQINPPPGYFSTLSTAELDPKNYKHVPKYWTNRIPFAGKPYQRKENPEPLIG